MNKIIKATLVSAVRYVYDDLTAKYGLLKPAYAIFTGRGVGVGNAAWGPLRIMSDRDGSAVRLEAAPFDASAGYWNGPNVIPDDCKDGSFEASLWHDLLWAGAEPLAKQLGMSMKKYLEWSNGILYAGWRGYAQALYPDAHAVKTKSWLAWWLCKLGAWFKRHGLSFSAVIALAIGAMAATENGCDAPPDWQLEDASPVYVAVIN